MLLTAWRDLQFRRRRFVSAVLGASLVFALSLTVAGLAASFDHEVDATVHHPQRVLTGRRLGDHDIARLETGPHEGADAVVVIDEKHQMRVR